MPNKKLEAKIVSTTPEYDGKFLKINKLEIEADLHEGGKQNITRYMMERGHAVGILAYDPAHDKVVLVNEMRPGILSAGGYPYTDTLPAGGISKGETAIDAAVREMREETGLEMKNARIIHDKAYVSAGGTSESISIVFGTVDITRAGGIHGNADEKENIKSTVLKTSELMERIKSGEINDMKTMVAAYWLDANKHELKMEFNQQAKPEAAQHREAAVKKQPKPKKAL